jgi:hypothetical protein
MNNDLIARFLDTQTIPEDSCVKIDMKKRNAIFGYFVKANDYEDLKSKNLWRFVLHNNIVNWRKKNDFDFAKIFNGTEFIRLSVVNVAEPMSVV